MVRIGIRSHQALNRPMVAWNRPTLECTAAAMARIDARLSGMERGLSSLTTDVSSLAAGLSWFRAPSIASGIALGVIFGVAYHVIPRFTGNPLHSRRAAEVQWWLANGGLALFVAGLALLPNTMYSTPARIVVGVGGILSAAAAYLFVYNIWRTIDGRASRRSATSAETAPAAVTALQRRAAS